MNRYNKIIIAIAGLFLLLLLVNIGLNWWIEVRLPGILSEKNDSPYQIKYKDVDVSIFSSSIIAKEITVVPKSSLQKNAPKAGIFAEIGTVEVSHFKLWDLAFNDKLRAKSIRISKPEITLYKGTEKAKENKSRLRSEIVEPFTKVVVVSAVFIDNGNLKIIDNANKTSVLSIRNVSAIVDGIVVTDDLLEHKIPFAFDSYSVNFDSLYYKPNQFYHIRTTAVQATKSGLLVKNIQYIPEYSRAAFVKVIPKEKDLYTIKAAAMNVEKMDWGFKGDKFYLHAGKIGLESVFANIYRGKMPPDDLRKKPLYSKLLREMRFDLQVDTFAVRNSVLEYEEEKSQAFGAGKISFHKFNLYARHLNSGYGKKKLPPLTIAVNAMFMNSSPLKINWTMNILDPSDRFHIKGSIADFPAENLTPFTKPYMNVTAKGNLDEIYFDFTGNDRGSKGDFAINYDDLKVTIYRKEQRKKKNKILSAIANLFVKKDTDEHIKNAEVDVERIPEKSFFNLLWLSLADGLKKIII